VARRWRRPASRGAVTFETVGVVLIGVFLYAKGRLVVEMALAVPDPGAPDFGSTSAPYSALLAVSVVPALVSRSSFGAAFGEAAASSPARVMVTSFVAAILVGTGLLSLPVAVVEIHNVSILEALFTATSAVCVTGLAVNDVAATYSRVGHVFILVLVQAGGLGIMTLGTTAAVFAGRRPTSPRSHSGGARGAPVRGGTVDARGRGDAVVPSPRPCSAQGEKTRGLPTRSQEPENTS
jgi:hypothetical protein